MKKLMLCLIILVVAILPVFSGIYQIRAENNNYDFVYGFYKTSRPDYYLTKLRKHLSDAFVDYHIYSTNYDDSLWSEVVKLNKEFAQENYIKYYKAEGQDFEIIITGPSVSILDFKNRIKGLVFSKNY